MDLENVYGIGTKTMSLLNKLGINNISDLVNYCPFRYDILSRSNLNELKDGDKIIIDGLVEVNPRVIYLKRKMDKMSFVINTGSKLMNVSIFNRGFLKPRLGVGTKLTIIGKYSIKQNLIVASDIRFGLLGNNVKIEPVYHVTSGINSNMINSLILKCIDNYECVDYIPNYLKEKYDFLSKKQSLREIHEPLDETLLKRSIMRFKYEELFTFMLKVAMLKELKKQDGLKRDVSFGEISKIISTLPYKLTIDQLKAIDDIYNDLISNKRMNRLLQGDVGSGKTIVSFIALYINYLSGYQGALMAPTEILAYQHYLNMKKLFSDLRIELLTGKLKVSAKKDIYKRLINNEIDVLIGTHALISNDVTYNNLGLVITDEQHRFGVNQRSNLKNKGIMPDVLYMSATPIPRTYAITLFGDMDISSIKTKPNGRKEIKTYLKSESEIKDVLTLMYNELKSGHQVYVIAPLIEESDKSELKNVNELKVKMDKAFGKLYNIDIMHGKLSNKAKEEVMEKFKNNDIQILISTTVIEVGVDVANATVMVVFDSYRFGLSALHQLRGRVGRSDLQSYFVLVSNYEAERLKVLVDTNDGFKVSEADFKMRGGGDLFGIRQSGDMSFKFADLKKDYKMLLTAKEDSEEFLKCYKDDYEYICAHVKLVDTLD